ncbi:MAG: 1-(5-phosphoribosyl)-5-[(5-phosphoribosylamino)methylideneamino] imidazole-4-carboxamide isomerase [Burkholderiaceae bacterium]
MLLIPAIDLKDGHCVRLRQGDMNDATLFSEDPAAMARHWVAQGARRLHLVDLNGAVRVLDDGLAYVIIGTAAVKNPGFLHDACGAFPGQIIVGLDAKDGKVATDGWSKMTRHEVIDLARKFEDYGVEALIYTDIGRDGMLSGINIAATVKLAQSVTIPIIASGGLARIEDVEALCAIEDEGVNGVICGRAIYTGDLDFKSAQAKADALSPEE